MEDERTNSVRVVRRAIDVLEAFDEASIRLGLGEIAARIGLPKTTTFRLVSTLVEAGYLVQPSGQDYCLSSKVMRLASIAQRSFDIRDIARPVLVELARTTAETLELSVLEVMRRVCLDVVESPHRLKSIIAPGEVLPLHLGATGKALLAHAPVDTVERVIEAARGEIDGARFRDDLRRVRERGYASSQGERVPGASALAVPLHDHLGQVRHTLTITGPSFRLEGRGPEFARLLVDGGRRVSGLLGHRRAVPDARAS